MARRSWTVPAAAAAAGLCVFGSVSALLIPPATKPALTPVGHCASFLDHCVLDISTSSCTFTQSVAFTCGMHNTTVTVGDVGVYAEATNGSGASGDALEIELEDWGCRWNVAGDLVLAHDVEVDVLGDDCFLRLTAGRMVIFGDSSTLRASSISIDASFVRVEPQARILASYSGMYRNRAGMFTGSASLGASYAGSGGRFMGVDDQADDPTPAVFGFFDVRRDTFNQSEDENLTLISTSESWNLQKIWSELSVENAPTIEDLTGEANARLLLGSGSATVANPSTGELLRVNGGGRIRIAASSDVVIMTGARIAANGDPAIDGVAGGSGGSVLLSASALSVNGQIEVTGGNAFCRPDGSACFPAGGGGRVQISYVSSQVDDSVVDTTGGTLPAPVSKQIADALEPTQLRDLVGATGTYYHVVRRSDGSSECTLSIGNGQQSVSVRQSKGVGGAVTSVNAKRGQKDAQMDVFAIKHGAVVASQSLYFKNGDLHVLNGSYLIECVSLPSSQPSRLDIDANDVLITDRSQILIPNAIMAVNARSVTMDASTALQFSSHVHIRTEQNLVIDAEVSSDALSTAVVSSKRKQPVKTKVFALQSNGDVTLGRTISVGMLSVVSRQSIEVEGELHALNAASALATYLSCTQQLKKKMKYDPHAINVNFTMVLRADKSITIGQPNQPAILEAGAVLLCAENEINLASKSVVTANGMGELANQGPGSGKCVGSIGGGGSYGGRGADSSSVNEVGDYATGGLPYSTRSGVGMLGSGGGCVNGGTGGGVIMLDTADLLLNGEIYCDGNDGVSGAGGGSGGYLGITVSEYLRGHGRISAVGGNSDCPVIDLTNLLGDIGASAGQGKPQPVVCGGGGGGGRLQLTGCEKSTFDECTSGFDGNYTVAGGMSLPGINNEDAGDTGEDTESVIQAGASGTFFGFPCPPGAGGLFCRQCAVGKYKSESNSEECTPCQNAPSNAHYVTRGSSSANCEWACDPGYSGYSCVSPLQQLLDACGGEFGFALVLLGIVLFFILLGFACRNRKEPSYVRMYNSSGAKGERQHLLSSAVANSQRRRFAFLRRCFYWPRVAYPKLLERDLSEHMARIYFNGLNDQSSPLKLRTTVPPSLKAVLYDDEFRELAERMNRALGWRTGLCSSWGEIFYLLIALLCYPFASEVMSYRRHIRINALKRIVAKYNHACMKGPRARGLLNAFKLGYSADYTLVHLELLYKESSQSVCIPTTPIGKPSLPLVLLFAGCGTYYSPFYLDPNDLLVRSIPQCPQLTAFIDEPWIEFVAELNELLRLVQRDEASLVETLVPVAKFLERKMAIALSGNGRLGGLRIYLGRFYIDDEFDDGEEFKLGIFLTTASESTINNNEPKERNDASNRYLPQTANVSSGTSNRYYGMNKDSGYGSYYHGSYPRGLDALDTSIRPRNSSIGAADVMLYDLAGWSGPPSSSRATGRRASLGASTGLPTAAKIGVSSIREEALRGRSSTAGSIDGGNGRGDDLASLLGTDQRRIRRRRTFYEGWLGPVDASLPVPGVLIGADELEDRLMDRSKRQVMESFLKMHLLPRNVSLGAWQNLAWLPTLSLLVLLMVDLAITFAMVVNLKCVTNGEVDQDCSASIMIPVLMVPPLTLIMSPIMGIISLALSSTTFSRRYSVWNALSMINVAIAIVACIAQSSRLVAPWFTGPLPLLPIIAMLIKCGEAFVIERYIAFQETSRRRRGWRGLMKRRLSDVSIPPESP